MFTFSHASDVSFLFQEAEGVVMAIPMPGHPEVSREEGSVLDDCGHLNDLILSHDAIFLLTDTRESRWLPTLLCANNNKVNLLGVLGRNVDILHFIFCLRLDTLAICICLLTPHSLIRYCLFVMLVFAYSFGIYLFADHYNCSSWV